MRVFQRRGWFRFVAVLAVLALVAAACGGDDGADDTEATTGTTGETAAERPFEGVTLKLAKAPFGEDEKDLTLELLQPFMDDTGIMIEHTTIPWDQLEALYTANFAGNDPFDVMYQTSTHLTLFGDQGAFVDMTSLLNGADYADDRARFPDSIINASVYQDKLYGVPFIIGTIVMYANLDLLAEAGVTDIPETTEELIAAGTAVVDNTDAWGFYTPTTVNDFGWYFNLQNVHNFGGDIIADDFSSATMDSDAVRQATQYAVDLVCNAQVQPPLGQYDREGAIALFQGGELAFLLDEPLRVTVFEDAALPFDWDMFLPVGSPAGVRTTFSTTGHWVIAEKSEKQEAAWELVKFLSSPDFSGPFNERYGFIPTRDDVDITGGNELLARNFEWAMTTWDGLVTHPQINPLLDEYVKALEAATTCQTSVDEALTNAQDRASEILGG